MPRTASRLEENRTTHAADFEGGSNKVYLPRIAPATRDGRRRLTAAP